MYNMKVIQLTSGGVLHAVVEKKGRVDIWKELSIGGRSGTYNPQSRFLKVPCKQRGDGSELELDEQRVTEGEVTCAACRKKLGLDPKPKPSCKRYLLVDTRTNKYYKKMSYKDLWVDEMLAATLYKVHYPPYWAKGKEHYKMKELCIYLED